MYFVQDLELHQYVMVALLNTTYTFADRPAAGGFYFRPPSRNQNRGTTSSAAKPLNLIFGIPFDLVTHSQPLLGVMTYITLLLLCVQR